MTALPSPKLRHVYRVDANLDALVDLGETPEGHRRIIAWTGGRAEGPDFHAEVLGTGGADWQIVRPSGSSVADIRYTLKTDRGALLYVQSRGVRHGKPDVLARLAAGEDVDPSEYTFRTAVSIETSDPELSWLNAQLLRAAAAALPPSIELVELDPALIKAIPAFDEDDEARAGGDDIPALRAMRDEIAGADAVLFATPEYNASIPGALKNALDWPPGPK